MSIFEIEWFRSCYALPKCSQVQRLVWGLIDLSTNNGSIVVLVHVDYPCQLPYLYFVIRKRSRLLIVLVLHRKPLLTTESTHNRRKRFINVPLTWQKLFPWLDCLTKNTCYSFCLCYIIYLILWLQHHKLAFFILIVGDF